MATAKAEANNWKQKYEVVSKELALANKRNSFLDSVSKHNPEKYRTIKGAGEATALLILSDWHVEETVDPTTVNDLNSYDPTIAQNRIKNMFQRALMLVDTCRTLSKIDTLVVAALGDHISGYIHPELEETNSLSPTEATLLCTDLLINGLRFLKKEGGFKSIIVPTCYGNHGRTHHKKRCASGYANSYEWLMYQNIARMMKNDAGITWKIDNGYFNFLDVQGYTVRFHHGDNIKFAGGVGGITIPVNKALSQWNKVKRADYDYFGHYHQSINMNRWNCNGSVIGYGAYALSIKAEYEEPSQTLSIISRKRGKILTDRVFCD